MNQATLHTRYGSALLAIALSMPLAIAHAADPAPASNRGWTPTRPITIIAGFAPGGTSDQIARNLAAAAKDLSPVPIVVVNKPGAAGTLAAASTAIAKPDGYTLFIGGGSETTSVGNHQALSYDPHTSFRSIVKVAASPSVLVVRADSPFKDMRALLAAAKAEPGKLSYASTGQGGIFHSTALMLQKISGIEFLHVPYKGAAESMTALLGGQIDMAFGAPDEIGALIKAGQIRPIAIFSNKRFAGYPDVPTMTELGYPVALDNMKGLLAPAGLPDDVYLWLRDTFHQAMLTTEFQNYAKTTGLTLDYQDGPTFQREINEGYDAVHRAISR